jgi:hypothetical protein
MRTVGGGGEGGTSACSRCLGSTANGSLLLAAELVPSVATQDGTANSPRVAGSNRKQLTDAVPDLGTCRMLTFPPRPVRNKSEMREETMECRDFRFVYLQFEI